MFLHVSFIYPISTYTHRELSYRQCSLSPLDMLKMFNQELLGKTVLFCSYLRVSYNIFHQPLKQVSVY